MPDSLFLLAPCLVVVATVVTLVRLARRPLPTSGLDGPPVGRTDAGHFFFLPSTPTAWAEVCRNAEASGGTTPGPWSHPLIGEALEDAGPDMRDGKSVLTYVEFARVYETRRRARLEHCTAAYLHRV